MSAHWSLDQCCKWAIASADAVASVAFSRWAADGFRSVVDGGGVVLE